MSKTIAFIPARGGSKGIEKKNIKLFCGYPLIYYSLWAAINSKVTWIFVATEDEEIRETVYTFKRSYDTYGKIAVFDRSKENAQDDSTTESVMIEFLNKYGNGKEGYIAEDDLFLLVQCTNPFIKSIDLNLGITMMDHYDSVLSVTRINRFVWTKNFAGEAYSINYRIDNRPRRQDFHSALFMENGAFYITTVKGFKTFSFRLNGKIGMYEMPEYSSIELDTPRDWEEATRIKHALWPN